MENKRFGLGGVVLLLRDHAEVEHFPQDGLLPLLILFRIDKGVIKSRILCYADDGGGFGQRKLADIFAEISFGRRLHAVGILREKGGVQVKFEDFLPGILLIEI
ncbi:hypothetical protein SDC9_167230 [bioreactor metagenome]|uniref:Uncharacterized protein n=1 Tax=bioreactor metagenome TaxID=1076179 RepID=A0A645FZ84_9ZZZZ